MTNKLFEDRNKISDILRSVVDIADEYYAQQQVLQPSRLVNDRAFEDLTQEGLGATAVLEHFRNHYAPHMANSAGPRYFGFVTGGSTPAAVAGDWLVSVYDQVMSGSNDSAAHVIERQALHFLKQLLGLDAD